MFLGFALMAGLPTLFIISIVRGIRRKSTPWTITAVATGLLGFGMVGLLNYYGAKTTTETISRPEAAFTIDVPMHWRELYFGLGSEPADLEVGSHASQEYLMVISEPRADYDGEMDAAGYAQLVSDAILEFFKDGRRSELTPIAVNGMSGWKCEIQGSRNGVRLHYLVTLLEGEDHFFQLVFWTSPSKVAVALPVFEEVATTLRQTTVEKPGP